MILSDDILSYIDAHWQETLDLLSELAQIPAPSHREQLRAEFCKNWLHAAGAADAYIDDALNVILPIGCAGENPLMVFMAHSDVVFPDSTPLPLHMDGNRLFCPGIGDDTANVVALLMAAKFITEHHLVPRDCGLLLVVNSCEEGLGNLKGCRHIMNAFGHRVREFLTFDSGVYTVINDAVGSRRYKVEVRTEGGHSYDCFGRRSAIAALAELITELYAQQVPALGKTTYNVGTVSGGTSVNTIAQQAEMLYEFRSDKAEALEIMENRFRAILSAHQESGLAISVTPVGDRPCAGDVPPSAQQTLSRRAASAVEHNFGHVPSFGSGSTDCNIPLSMGIPAICIGCADGCGAHTREEFIYIDSLKKGLGVAFELILHHI